MNSVQALDGNLDLFQATIDSGLTLPLLSQNRKDLQRHFDRIDRVTEVLTSYLSSPDDELSGLAKKTISNLMQHQNAVMTDRIHPENPDRDPSRTEAFRTAAIESLNKFKGHLEAIRSRADVT